MISLRTVYVYEWFNNKFIKTVARIIRKMLILKADLKFK